MLACERGRLGYLTKYTMLPKEEAQMHAVGVEERREKTRFIGAKTGGRNKGLYRLGLS